MSQHKFEFRKFRNLDRASELTTNVLSSPIHFDRFNCFISLVFGGLVPEKSAATVLLVVRLGRLRTNHNFRDSPLRTRHGETTRSRASVPKWRSNRARAVLTSGSSDSRWPFVMSRCFQPIHEEDRSHAGLLFASRRLRQFLGTTDYLI